MEFLDSGIINERLKELRESKKLSHEKLAKELTEKYGGKGQNEYGEEKYRLSKQILIDYENKDKVNGMSIGTLNMFSDFYNVSTDYILGLTDIKTSNTTIKDVCDITGLNEESIKSLEILKGEPFKDFEPIKWLNEFLVPRTCQAGSLAFDPFREVRIYSSIFLNALYDIKEYKRAYLKNTEIIKASKNISKEIKNYPDILEEQINLSMLTSNNNDFSISIKQYLTAIKDIMFKSLRDSIINVIEEEAKENGYNPVSKE